MFKKGAIILIPFPFTDLSANKVRPALIISSNKILGDDIIVAFISSKKIKRLQKTDVSISVKIQDFYKTGLKTDSIVKINKIATLDKKIILGELGKINKKIQNEVDKRIKILFDL